MIGLIREQLVRLTEDIDAGNSNIDEEDEVKLVKLIKLYTRKDVPMSKYQACKYLGMSRAKFDNLVKNSELPEGKKTAGFKELSWERKDLDKYLKKHGNESNRKNSSLKNTANQ